MIRRLRRNWPLTLALAAMAVGLLLVLSQLYPAAWADNTVGPLIAAGLLPVYAMASYAMTPRKSTTTQKRNAA